jgi:hypothetical protein
MGGRVYTTAIGTLTLEIYYRHTPAFLAGEVLFGADDWRAALERLAPRERLTAVACLGQLRLEVGEPALVELLADKEPRVGVAAAEALASLDSPAGVPLLERTLPTLPPWQQQALQRAVERAKAVLALPPVEGRVRLFDLATGRATLDLPRSYVGMHVRAYRAGEVIAHMQVIQRFTGRTVVVAECTGPPGPTVPQGGDRAIGQ